MGGGGGEISICPSSPFPYVTRRSCLVEVVCLMNLYDSFPK